MRRALHGRADEVCVPLLLSAALGGARVRAPPACSRLRAGFRQRAMLAQKQSEESEEEQEVFLVACSYAVKKRRLEEQLARSFAVGARLFLDAYVKYRGGFIGGRRQQGGDRQVWMAIARSVHTDLPVLPPPQRTCI